MARLEVLSDNITACVIMRLRYICAHNIALVVQFAP